MNDKVKDNPSLEKILDEVDYSFFDERYIPSKEALAFITFIKLVNGKMGEENKSPVFHMDMIDGVNKYNDNLFVSFRGSAKTSLLHEYMFLYLAVYGEFFDFGEVSVAMYIGDTIDNGIKSMRKNLEFRYDNSEFLQTYIKSAKFTDVRWEFTNVAGHNFCVRGFGASTGVRGFKEYGTRPTWAGFDDLMSDKNAESATITRDIKNIIYKAARQAMHPQKRKIIWTGTPFNQRDPLYNGAGSKGWHTKVYPICEEFPCVKEEFRGAWPDRFPYEFIKHEYDTLSENGEIASFNQELMLRIMSLEDRLILDSDISWYKHDLIMQNISAFNYYVTTDFATSDKQHSDFSVISVWAYNNKGMWFWVDGICKKQGMGVNIDDLFHLCQKWKPLQVGVEVSGQQGGFIPWIQNEMITRNTFFNFATDNNSNQPGIRPNTHKMVRFNIMIPMFKAKQMFFPIELKDGAPLQECVNELQLISAAGMKSRHDDFIDTISMLSSLTAWRPSDNVVVHKNKNDVWETEEEDSSTALGSYIV